MRKTIAERSAADPSFPVDARSAALGLLAEKESDYVRRAIQVLSVIATSEDIDVLRAFLRHRNPEVRKDARACLFELGVQT